MMLSIGIYQKPIGYQIINQLSPPTVVAIKNKYTICKLCVLQNVAKKFSFSGHKLMHINR